MVPEPLMGRFRELRAACLAAGLRLVACPLEEREQPAPRPVYPGDLAEDELEADDDGAPGDRW